MRDKRDFRNVSRAARLRLRSHAARQPRDDGDALAQLAGGAARAAAAHRRLRAPAAARGPGDAARPHAPASGRQPTARAREGLDGGHEVRGRDRLAPLQPEPAGRAGPLHLRLGRRHVLADSRADPHAGAGAFRCPPSLRLARPRRPDAAAPALRRTPRHLPRATAPLPPFKVPTSPQFSPEHAAATHSCMHACARAESAAERHQPPQGARAVLTHSQGERGAAEAAEATRGRQGRGQGAHRARAVHRRFWRGVRGDGRPQAQAAGRAERAGDPRAVPSARAHLGEERHGAHLRAADGVHVRRTARHRGPAPAADPLRAVRAAAGARDRLRRRRGGGRGQRRRSRRRGSNALRRRRRRRRCLGQSAAHRGRKGSGPAARGRRRRCCGRRGQGDRWLGRRSFGRQQGRRGRLRSAARCDRQGGRRQGGGGRRLQAGRAEARRAARLGSRRRWRRVVGGGRQEEGRGEGGGGGAGARGAVRDALAAVGRRRDRPQVPRGLDGARPLLRLAQPAR